MVKEKHPFVSIIFPNWNGKDDVIDCLNSLQHLDYPKDKLEIIISDNGSVDGSQEIINKKYSDMKEEGWFALKLIENYKNLGPSLARNIGIKSADDHSQYIWLIDNDITAEKSSLKELVRVAENNNKIGIVGSINYFFNEPNKICYCGNVINWKTFRFKRVDEKVIKEKSILKVDDVSGCSLLIKSETLNKIGVFKPDYFCYYNDTDLCTRVKKKGYDVCIASRSKVWHKVSSSTKKISGFQIYFKTRNLILLVKRNITFYRFLIFLMFLLVFHIPRELLKLIMNLNFSNVFFLFKGAFDGIFSKQYSIISKNFSIN